VARVGPGLQTTALLVPPGSGGLNQATGLAFGPDGYLYVASHLTNTIQRYDAVIGTFVDQFAPQPGDPVPNAPHGIVFGADGHLYVSSAFGDAILRYDGLTGAFIDAIVPLIPHPSALAFAPTGELCVNTSEPGGIRHIDCYDISTSPAVLSRSFPVLGNGLAFRRARDGTVHFYVNVNDSDSTQRCDFDTGSCEIFIAAGSSGLDTDNEEVHTHGILFSGQDLFITGGKCRCLVRYSANGGAFLGRIDLDNFVADASYVVELSRAGRPR
jgi:glucose/arabinose dehydrogenase